MISVVRRNCSGGFTDTVGDNVFLPLLGIGHNTMKTVWHDFHEDEEEREETSIQPCHIGLSTGYSEYPLHNWPQK